ncbi:MAG: DegT/DnrJ/EryC1/StrS family aminotransferase [Phycisphaerae bacterium]|nr:DegT/DnrJ/EryC1/StrS family aminotransferase [Phycisphaerae bacterium]
MELAFPKFDERERELIGQCLESRWVTQGPMVRRFEELFAARQRVPFSAAASSGTAALHLAVLALGIGPGDEVIVPAYTWVSSAHCVEYAGAKAVLVDIDLSTYNLDPQAAAAAITPRTRAILPVHLFGLPAEMDSIRNLAEKHNLAVIEDAACAVGSEYQGSPLGGLGDVGCFSFHPRKIISTGEGGMVTTRDAGLADRVRSLRNIGAGAPREAAAGQARPYHLSTFDVLGYNLRMSDILAAVGVAQMEKLDNLLAERRGLAQRYDALLGEMDGVAIPAVPADCSMNYQSYVVRVTRGGLATRNHLMDALVERNIASRPGTHAVHRLGYYVQKYHLRPEDCPNAARAEDETISIPLFPGMTSKNQDLVAETIQQALGRVQDKGAA